MGENDDSRTRILDAAERHFADCGFDATPTARIAETAEVPKGLVFYHFPKKTDLLLALLDERLPLAARADLEGVAVPGDPAASLVRLHERLGLEEHGSLVVRSIVFREAGTHPEVTAALRRLREHLVDEVAAVLRTATGDEVGDAQVRQAAAVFTAVMLDHANAARLGGLGTDVGAAADLLARALGRPATGAR